eukprot:TRINITY_DN18027_c0_g1_i1.p1 TRINITY_DN18027_c0_g1~~TRINITY_DN18027_c0_g1_i1.p1  ORF type:complete len:353 (+),score=39.49 TRINITY_DN18027_c0_g1_i1:66-1061(+)
MVAEQPPPEWGACGRAGVPGESVAKVQLWQPAELAEPLTVTREGVPGASVPGVRVLDRPFESFDEYTELCQHLQELCSQHGFQHTAKMKRVTGRDERHYCSDAIVHQWGYYKGFDERHVDQCVLKVARRVIPKGAKITDITVNYYPDWPRCGMLPHIDPRSDGWGIALVNLEMPAVLSFVPPHTDSVTHPEVVDYLLPAGYAVRWEGDGRHLWRHALDVRHVDLPVMPGAPQSVLKQLGSKWAMYPQIGQRVSLIVGYDPQTVGVSSVLWPQRGEQAFDAPPVSEYSLFAVCVAVGATTAAAAALGTPRQASVAVGAVCALTASWLSHRRR